MPHFMVARRIAAAGGLQRRQTAATGATRTVIRQG
jgi:hypothetical protein